MKRHIYFMYFKKYGKDTLKLPDRSYYVGNPYLAIFLPHYKYVPLRNKVMTGLLDAWQFWGESVERDGQAEVAFIIGTPP